MLCADDRPVRQTTLGLGRSPRPMICVRPADARDLPAILALLEDAGLGSEGVPHLLDGADTLLVADDGAVIGCVAVEVHDSQRLLRSLAVTPSRRRDGLGAELVNAAILAAAGADLFLLTEGAVGYFARFGFRPVVHSTVTGPVTGSDQWNGPCSTSATAMRLM